MSKKNSILNPFLEDIRGLAAIVALPIIFFSAIIVFFAAGSLIGYAFLGDINAGKQYFSFYMDGGGLGTGFLNALMQLVNWLLLSTIILFLGWRSTIGYWRNLRERAAGFQASHDGGFGNDNGNSPNHETRSFSKAGNA